MGALSYSPTMFELSKAVQARAQNSVPQLRAALTELKNVCYANSLGPESMVEAQTAAPSAAALGFSK